MNKLTKAD